MRRRTRRWTRQRQALTAGFLGGMIAGLVVWSAQMRRCRRDLFSGSAVRRLAALGYLSGHVGVESVHMLTDYVRWETNPLLRRRAERLLGRVRREVM